MEKMRNKVVWIIAEESDTPDSGPHNRHFELAHALVKKGYEPIVFSSSATRHSGKQMILGDSLYEVDESGGFPFVFVRTTSFGSGMKGRLKAIIQFHVRIRKVIENFPNPMAVLCSSPYPVTPIIGAWISKNKHCKGICEIRDLWPLALEEYGVIKKGKIIAKLMYRLERYIFEHNDEIIFTFPGGKKYISDRKLDKLSGGKINFENVHYINNGVNLNTYYFNAQEYIYQNSFYKQSKTKKVVYTGSLRRANNLDFLIDVFSYLINDGIDLFFFGRGEQEEYLKQKCKKENLQNVHFMGWVDKKYIPSILSSADLLVDFGVSENALMKYGASHNKFFDYLASGKPIISNHKMSFSLINKYECGIEHAFENPQTCAKTISDILNNPEILTLWGNNALKASEEFDFSNLSSELIKIIER